MKNENITYKLLEKITDAELELLNKWDNDPELVPYIRYSPDKKTLEEKRLFTKEKFEEQQKDHYLYMVYLGTKAVGTFNFMIDPDVLFKKEPGTGWPGIVIGEKSAHGRGIGSKIMTFIEDELRKKDIRRIELGVFEYNEKAIRLYKKCGYKEIGKIPDFTFWDDKMWQDIRMEKYI